MDSLVYNGVVNSLSFGNVSYNFLKEFYKRQISISFFPIGEKLDFEAFDSCSEDFKKWVADSAAQRFKLINNDIPTLTQWHINGSEKKLTHDQTLFTFYETDEPTPVETSIVNLQKNVVFGSSHAAKMFQEAGCKNVHHVPIGFDQDFSESEEEYIPEKIHFGLMGKFENRKNTAQILKNWALKYGNNFKYQLSCCINNPFFKPEQLNQLISQTLGGQQYGNINFLPHLKTNSEMNEFINAIDIDLTGLSGAEGWNIPAFNATALGKWSIVMNHTSHKDWANDKNCILVEPEMNSPIYDNMFFIQGQPFNQGSKYEISDELMIECFEKSENFCKKKNKEGVKLRKKFSYSKTVDQILNIIKK